VKDGNPLFEYHGELFPEYLKHGNAMQFIAPAALQFCKGNGLDVGCSQWPLPGAAGHDLKNGTDATNLPPGEWDYIFSSHCLEHVLDPVTVLEHWKTRLVKGGTLFLYLPHPDMTYWRPQHCRKHLHLFWPDDVAEMLRALGFVNIIHSERDLAWSFAVVAFNGAEPSPTGGGQGGGANVKDEKQ
jgi:SAM-dependent methyltransferase